MAIPATGTRTDMPIHFLIEPRTGIFIRRLTIRGHQCIPAKPSTGRYTMGLITAAITIARDASIARSGDGGIILFQYLAIADANILMVFFNHLTALGRARLLQFETVPDRQTQNSRDYNYNCTHRGTHFYVAG